MPVNVAPPSSVIRREGPSARPSTGAYECWNAVCPKYAGYGITLSADEVYLTPDNEIRCGTCRQAKIKAKFNTANPEVGGAAIGALLGLTFGGGPGAILGGLVGLILGKSSLRRAI